MDRTIIRSPSVFGWRVGIRGGQVHGSTDDLGWGVAGSVHVNDLHAILLSSDSTTNA